MRTALSALRPGLAAWWQGRSRRERALFFGMALLLGLSAVQTGIVRPLLATRAEATARIAEYDRALALLAAEPAGPPPAGGGAVAPASTVLTDAAGEFGLAILRIEPEGAGARLVLADADFARVIRWIAAVERASGLAPTRIEIDRRPEPGTVGAALSFGRP